MTRSALVIGAAGFLGRELSRALEAHGWLVARASSRSGGADLTVDLRDIDSVRNALAAVLPAVTFSLAAPKRDAEPAEAFELLPGTLALLKEIPGLLVLAGSAAEYGASDEPRSFAEDAPLHPRAPYATAKAMQTILARGMGSRVTVARIFNLIGPGQPRGFLVSDLIARNLAGERPLRVRGAGSTRDLIDVRDAASALTLIAERDFCGEVNVGCGLAVPVGDVAGVVCDALGGEWVPEPGYGTGNHSVAAIDVLSALGWRPIHDWPSSVTEQALRAADLPGQGPVVRGSGSRLDRTGRGLPGTLPD